MEQANRSKIIEKCLPCTVQFICVGTMQKVDGDLLLKVLWYRHYIRKHWNTAIQSHSSCQRILLVNLLEWHFGLWIDNDATAFKRLDPNFLIADFLLPLQNFSARWNTILTRLLSRSVALSVETYLLFEKSIFKGEPVYPVYSGVDRKRYMARSIRGR